MSTTTNDTTARLLEQAYDLEQRGEIAEAARLRRMAHDHQGEHSPLFNDLKAWIDTKLDVPTIAPIERRAWIAAQFDAALAEVDPLRAVARALDQASAPPFEISPELIGATAGRLAAHLFNMRDAGERATVARLIEAVEALIDDDDDRDDGERESDEAQYDAPPPIPWRDTADYAAGYAAGKRETLRTLAESVMGPLPALVEQVA